MRELEAHKIERSVVLSKNRLTREFLRSAIEELEQRPDLAPTIFRRSVQLAGGTADGRKALAELRRGARCAALFFVHARHSDERSCFAWPDGAPACVFGPVDPGFANAPAWNEGMFCALAGGDEPAQQWLACVPVAELPQEGVTHGRFAYALGEFLRSVVTRDGRHGKWLAESMTLAEAPDTEATRDWVEAIEFPTLRAAYHVIDRDGTNFNEALVRLHEEHLRYWRSSENRLAVEGLLSLRGCALCRLADELGVPVEVDSRYMPRALWRSPALRPQEYCPYCVGPLAPGVRNCGLCGRAIKDAPLELTNAVTREAAPCGHCGHPMQKLAVVCPQCRTPRRG